MARKYGMNNYSTLLTSGISDTDTTVSVGTAPDSLGAGDFYRMQLCRFQTVNGQRVMVKSEFVDVTAISGNDLTIRRYEAGLDPDPWGNDISIPQTWETDDELQLVVTAETLGGIPDPSGFMPTSGGTLLDGTITEFTETINAAAGATLDRSTGGFQRLNLTANTTLNLTDLEAGQSVFYRVTAGDTWTLGYTGLGNWSDGEVPALSATHYLEFTHDGIEVVGFDCGGR